MEEFFDNLLLSLNSLEVKGENNLNILLGCILAVKNARAALAPRPVHSNKEEKDNG